MSKTVDFFVKWYIKIFVTAIFGVDKCVRKEKI